MKTVSLQELKRHLSALIKAVAAGERLLVTKHGQPIAELNPLNPHVHIGSRAHQGCRIEPAIRKPEAGKRLLELLQEDRGER